MSSHIRNLEALYCEEGEDNASCLENTSGFLDFTKAAALDYEVPLSKVHDTLSMCEPCLVEDDKENCMVKPFPVSHEDTTCGDVNDAMMATLSIVDYFEVEPSDAYEAFSMCEDCIDDKDSANCSKQLQEEIYCDDIRKHVVCSQLESSYYHEGCSEESEENETCRLLEEQLVKNSCEE